MSLTKTTTKTKSLTKTVGEFPAGGWELDMAHCIELPGAFRHKSWPKLQLAEPPGAKETRKELDRLLKMQNDLEERKRRLKDIIEQAQPLDVSSQNMFSRLLLLKDAHPKTNLLMYEMIVFGKIVAVYFKNQFMRARPSQMEPRLRPMIDVPGHPAYPSGHALQMFLVAKALTTVVRDLDIGKELFKIAAEIAENREWAGLHYPSDSAAGRELAETIFPLVLESFENSFQEATREWL
jgi:hypothetical protein